MKIRPSKSLNIYIRIGNVQILKMEAATSSETFRRSNASEDTDTSDSERPTVRVARVGVFL
jgi:hypothetical protein